MPSLTIENYVKTIYLVEQRQGNRPAATGQLAAELGVLPGTVTSMMKTLDESGLATYTPYEGVDLTDAGRALALRVLRRHRLIELFLARTLNLSWDEVHEEAENMEHAVSDRLVDRIDELLGFPATDPHGDPIPRADGTVATLDGRRLDQWEVGRPFQLVRVCDQSSAFLRYLSESGLELGAVAHIATSRPEAGALTLEVAGRPMAMSLAAAQQLLVTEPDGAPPAS